MSRIFFGYGSTPELLRSTVASAAAKLQAEPSVTSVVTWEDLRIDGRLILTEIEQAIDECTIAVFDLTTMNQNVLYELGLAIGKGKAITILLDSQDEQAAKRWKDLALLGTAGFTPYKNADELQARLAAIAAIPPRPLWDDLVEGADQAMNPSELLYIPSVKEDDASRRLSRIVEQYGKFEIRRIDLDEYGTAPLSWFAETLYAARYSIFHLTPERAYLAETNNARVCLFAGISRGLGRDIALIAERAEPMPLDLRDQTLTYQNIAELDRGVHNWLENLREPIAPSHPRVRKHLALELAALRFGNHVAESDIDGLDAYFVETSDFKDVLEARASIFTGRKGTGKTANMLQAARTLRSDARNLVCVVKPASYELEGLLEVLRKVDKRYLSDYLIEGLWKYLLFTEVGSRLVEEAEARPAGIGVGTALDTLANSLDERHFGARADFSVRLERLVHSLNNTLTEYADEGSIEEARQALSRALYSGTLKELKSNLASALRGRNRVAILIDNLDKAWERGADLKLLSRLLLGLLSSIGRVVDELNMEKEAKGQVNVTLTVFLRSDIFTFIREQAREPDKISVSEIEWRDKDLLARVLEDRFLASRKPGTQPEELWNQYFIPVIAGLPSRDYILSRVQPRPRDLVFFANAAVIRATNAKHSRIDESDVAEAERVYSQFAFEALVVEGVASSLDLETVLLSFAGESSVLAPDAVSDLLTIGAATADVSRIIEVLRQLGFIGIETSEDSFDYGGTTSEIRRADVRALKLKKTLGRPARFRIHPAYSAYLELVN